MKSFEVVYFHSPDPDAASWDTPWTIVVSGEDYEDAEFNFKVLKLGYLWSIDEVEA